MGKKDVIWGIDIGQCALKALRCRLGDDGEIVADAFDYVEYPQILSQPESDPVELVREAIQTFLSRNSVKGDGVAISVPGQSGLSRFIKLPPVEASKIPDIVKYEARQQIPFALEDVVWDYQQLSGGVEEGFALETEVGLFAMKREQVFRALQPFDEAGIEVDCVQLAPLALYNYAIFDQMQGTNTEGRADATDWVVVMSLGTDTTDLVLTNGARVWQRNIPLGGNHFTRALTKSMKLTFAKAEHVKRNATKSDDPKAVYQTMRSVCNDLVTEIHRSLSYFGTLEKESKIVRVIAMGNTMKLHGLPQFLSKHLEMNVQAADKFRALTGSTVLGSPAFKDNVMSFPVCYGLAIQGLDQARLKTNLLPREILKDRLVREKKPWVVAAAAAVLLALAISFFGHWQAWNSANVNHDEFKNAIGDADREETDAKNLYDTYTGLVKEFNSLDDVGKKLVQNVDGRVEWLEMLKAVNGALPQPDESYRDKPTYKRPELHIESVDCERFDKLEDWFTDVKDEWSKGKDHAAAATATPAPGGATPPAGGTPAPEVAAAASSDAPPAGPGWVIQLKGFHLFNEQRQGAQFVRDTLLKNLEEGTVELPVRENGRLTMQHVSLKDLGISHPVMLPTTGIENIEIEAEDIPVGVTGVPKVQVGRFDFIIQFCWRPTPPDKRQVTTPSVASDAAATSEPQRGGE